MIGFQLSKRPAIFYGSRLTKTMPKPSKISIRVAFIEAPLGGGGGALISRIPVIF